MHAHTIAFPKSFRAMLLAGLAGCVFAPPPARAQWQWTQRMVSGPPARHGHAMTYDAARGVIVLFSGGHPFFTTTSPDTWEWDGSSWAERLVSGPRGRVGHKMAYDSIRATTVLFGGGPAGYCGQCGGYGDTWEFDGTSWMPRVVTGPPGRLAHAMAYDTARGKTVLFGGTTPRYMQTIVHADTWEWDGTNWTERKVTGPSGRCGHAMVFDVDRGVIVLFGGTLPEKGAPSFSDTWEWDGTNWTERKVTGPAARSFHAMAFDAARDVTVLFGGGDHAIHVVFSDTWEWDGTNWAQRMVTGPASGGAMTYDAARDATVLFGNLAGETWELHVSCYADCDTTTGPRALDIFDFLCFLSRFAVGAPYACDCDTSTGPATCDFFDFLCFQKAFAAGCP